MCIFSLTLCDILYTYKSPLYLAETIIYLCSYLFIFIVYYYYNLVLAHILISMLILFINHILKFIYLNNNNNSIYLYSAISPELKFCSEALVTTLA